MDIDFPIKKRIKFFQFDELPSLKIEGIMLCTEGDSLEIVSSACQVRTYSLLKNWFVKVNNYPVSKLNGTIKIPPKHEGVDLLFDGASVPVPWLFSAVTFGIARPMGVMMTASVLHDFAYQHGYLLIKPDNSKVNEFQKVTLDRFEADDLFRDVMIDVTAMPKISYLGWMVLRLGWFYIDYAGKKKGPRKPYLEILPLIAGLVSSISLLFLAPKWLIALLIFIYFMVWFRLNKTYKSS